MDIKEVGKRIGLSLLAIPITIILCLIYLVTAIRDIMVLGDLSDKTHGWTATVAKAFDSL